MEGGALDPDVWTHVAYLACKNVVQEGYLLPLSFLPIYSSQVATIRLCLGTTKPQDDPLDKKKKKASTGEPRGRPK